MLREHLQNRMIGMNKEFRFRGQEPGRLENFSDAVFALAITLLLISTSPPSSFEQIKKFAWELVPFALCISGIILVWHQHFIFFFRYGLRNGSVMVLNTIFLVIVLFYVYPLKFLARAILLPLTKWFDDHAFHQELGAMYRDTSMADLMIIYGVGAMSLFFVLALLYRYALKKSRELELTEMEYFDTRSNMFANILMGAVPLCSVVVAFLLINNKWGGAIAGVTYFLYTPVMFGFWHRRTKKRNELLRSLMDS